METKQTTRNNYIDAVRGLAAIAVVWGHTFFYIGMWFIPDAIKSLGLVFEVPVFFLLSGWGASYHPTDLVRTFRGLLRVMLQWIFFVTVLAVVCWLTRWAPVPLEGVSGLSDLMHNYFLTVSFPSLPVVEGSVWFLPLFFAVGILNPLVMLLLERLGVEEKGSLYYLVVLLAIFVPCSMGHLLPDFLQSVLFYAIFWMLGRNRRRFVIDTAARCIGCMAAVAVGYLLFARLLGLPVSVVQEGKFPPTVAYGLWALIFIFPVFFFEGRLSPRRSLVHIGRNAIFYYFAQGVSTSLLCKVGGRFVLPALPKFVILFVLNLLLTMAVAEALRVLYHALSWDVGRKGGSDEKG